MAPRSEEPKLIIHVINFELVQLILSRYINVTDGRTDGQTDEQTDGRLTIAIPRFALRASRGKNACTNCHFIQQLVSPLAVCTLQLRAANHQEMDVTLIERYNHHSALVRFRPNGRMWYVDQYGHALSLSPPSSLSCSSFKVKHV